jgi:hypothetical protein
MRKYIGAAGLLCLLVSGFAFSQGGNSQLGGVATDTSGALLPGVTITVTNNDTSVANTTITNESGAYNFPALQPGANYSVSASLPGFQRKTVTNLPIGAAVNVRQDFQLQVAAQATTVEVSINANELLTTNSQSVGEVLTASRVQDLPIVGNDVLSLIGLMPGVRGDAADASFAGVDETRINTVRDGLSVSDGRFSSGVFSTTFINPDLVGEIRIVLTPVDAEMGRGNGQVIISTRSGTNRFSGAAQWDIRNTALNPNTWGNNNDIDPQTGAWLPTQPNWSNTHHYTVSFGGPIIRNKTFFYALWDQQLQYQRNLVTASVMTDSARNGIFRFFPGWNNGNAQSNTAITSTTTPAGTGAGTIAVVDFAGNPKAPTTFPNGTPYTGQLTCISVFGNIKADGTPFTGADCPGGTIIAGTWDSRRPVMDTTGYIAKILSKMPKANYFGAGGQGTAFDGLNNAAYRFVRTRRGNQGAAVTIGTDSETDRKQLNLKIDQNFNASHKLAANWSYERNDTYSDQPNWPDGIPYFTQRYPQVFTANLTSTLSSSLLNEGRFGIRYSRANIAAPHEADFYPDKAAVEEALQYTLPIAGYNVTVNPGAVYPGQGAATSNYAFGGTANGVINTNPGQYNGNTSYLYNYADTLSWTHGKHAFKFGGEYRHTVSNGYNNIGEGGGVRIPFARVNGGSDTINASELATAGSTTNGTTGNLLPNTVLANTNRTNSSNMLYFLAGSVSTVSSLYWIDDAGDVENGTWESVVTKKRKFRDTVENEMSFFFKDDWKVSRDLTLNLGLRWDWYGSPFIGSGFTSTAIGRGLGLFGNRQNPADIFSPWLAPGNTFLSGYGPNAGVAALQCTQGVSNGPNLPASNCDSNLLTTIEFVGPNTPNPNKSAYPNDKNNFGPAVGFSYNSNLLGSEHPITVRGGYQITFGGSGRVVGGGGATATETVIGSAPGSIRNADTVTGDFSNKYLNLTNIPELVPVRPTIAPGGTNPIFGQASFSAIDPNFVTPYTQNFNFSVTTSLSRRLTMDVRYIGTRSVKQQSSVNLNTNNVYFNQELLDALQITRQGGNAPLFDQMLAGLNLNNGVTGYGIIGTCVTAVTGAPGAGLEGCPAGQVMQHGSAHLRRNATTRGPLANGNFSSVAGTLLGNGPTGIPTVGTAGGLLLLPDSDPATAGVQQLGGVTNRRMLRNGCDRLAAGLTTISTRCFAEDYMTVNPQLATATFVTNGNSSNYHSLQTQMTLRPTAGLSLQGTYTWSKNLGISGTATDPTNRNADYSFTDGDRRHEFRMNGTFELPIGPNKLFMGNSSGLLARVLERWQTGMILNWNSGALRDIEAPDMLYDNGVPDIVGPFPFKKGTVRWNGDNNATGTLHGGTYFGNPNPFITVDDPQCANIGNVVDSQGYNLFNTTDNNCTINALAVRNPDGTPGQLIFQTPLPGKRGTLGRRSLEQPGRWSLDANLSKTFQISESKSLQIRIDTTNVLNHPSLASGNNLNTPVEFDAQDANFGQITGTVGKSGGRSFQGSLRLQF